MKRIPWEFPEASKPSVNKRELPPPFCDVDKDPHVGRSLGCVACTRICKWEEEHDVPFKGGPDPASDLPEDYYDDRKAA